MPKVTDAHRESRREQIIAAAVTCFAEKGFQRTSMADIIAASGLSAGAIYLQFESKQQIALAVGRTVLGRRLDELTQPANTLRDDPVDMMQTMMAALVSDVVDTRILLQLWGEATSDPEMTALVAEVFDGLRVAWTRYLEAWAAQEGATDPAGWAHRSLPAILGIAQGFVVQRALVPGFDADAYFASIRLVTGRELLDPA